MAVALVFGGGQTRREVVVRGFLSSVAGLVIATTAVGATPALATAASAEVSFSLNPTQSEPVEIKVSGIAVSGGRLYVLLQEMSTYPCGPTPDADAGSSLSSGEALASGNYEKTFDYTPTEATTYKVCAYVDDEPYDTPDATGAGTFSARMPAATLSLMLSSALSENQPVTITASGATEVSRSLYVLVQDVGTYPCGSTPDADAGSLLASGLGEAFPAGAYSRSFVYTPTATTSYKLCGYIDESEYGIPDAVTTASFTNVTPKTRAEERQRAAEAKAEEERRALVRYEAEAPARLAARVKAEAAQLKEAEAAARARAHKTPVSHLSVAAVAHPRHSSKDPGYTDLDVTTSPYAEVVVKLARHGRRTREFEWGGNTTELAEVIGWTCRSPGGVYRYVVTAKSGVGPTLVRRGVFAPVSAARCSELKRQEQQARDRNERQAAEEQDRVYREELEVLTRYERNCVREGGTPITLERSWGSERNCRGPNGGLIAVPH